jgi:hypothetical protein
MLQLVIRLRSIVHSFMKVRSMTNCCVPDLFFHVGMHGVLSRLRPCVDSQVLVVVVWPHQENMNLLKPSLN